MSTAIKRLHEDALADAETFRAMFDGCAEVWTFAGSLRRKTHECSDVEHVVIPRFADLVGGGLFAEPTNLLWQRMEALVADGPLVKHLYGNGFRWGQKYRGVDYCGYLHEIFCATADNYGPTLAIRTGSADFSRRLVTGLLRNGRRNHEGKVWRCKPCIERDGAHCDTTCPKCQGTHLVPLEAIAVPDEETYFKLCGVAFVPAEKRI